MKAQRHVALILIATLTACGGGSNVHLMPVSVAQPKRPPQSAAAPASLPAAGRYKSLYSFKGGADGAEPLAGLIDVDGTLYGTTSLGGGSGCYYGDGCGTVFKITTSGTEQVLYAFKGGTDGADPLAGLTDVNGTLYGTTYSGGGGKCYLNLGCGTVFSITASGTERVLHRFGTGTDGANPFAGLINVNKTLYGTTTRGGAKYGAGTVFTITTSGKEHVLYSFGGESYSDGGYPQAGLQDFKGMLFGTTRVGGRGGGGRGFGSVFEVSMTGKERVLYSFNFKSSIDGIWPEAGVIDVNGMLYGTTFAGGGTANGGTIFKVNPKSGKEVMRHSFGKGADGAYPEAGLIDVNGMLYGTTTGGGGADGTVFAVSTGGNERVLYRFRGGTDGAFPSAGLTLVHGALFGTTSLGGGASNDGTVFKLAP